MTVKTDEPTAHDEMKTIKTHEMLHVSWNCKNFLQFSKIFEPQFIALNMLSNLSFKTIKDELSFATEHPERPIESPTLDFSRL